METLDKMEKSFFKTFTVAMETVNILILMVFLLASLKASIYSTALIVLFAVFYNVWRLKKTKWGFLDE